MWGSNSWSGEDAGTCVNVKVIGSSKPREIFRSSRNTSADINGKPVLGLSGNLQTMRAGFKEIRFIIHQMKRTGRYYLSKFHCPTSERKCPLFKGEFCGWVGVHNETHVSR
jgi:hypothetical protein